MAENESKKTSQPKMLVCPRCGTEVSARRRYCTKCGAVIRGDMHDGKSARQPKVEEEPKVDAEPKASVAPENSKEHAVGEETCAVDESGAAEQPTDTAEPIKKTKKSNRSASHKESVKSDTYAVEKADTLENAQTDIDPDTRPDGDGGVSKVDTAEKAYDFDNEDLFGFDEPTGIKAARSEASEAGKNSNSGNTYNFDNEDLFGFDDGDGGKTVCPSCGKENENNAKFCAYCGATLIEPVKCGYCGANCMSNEKFCRRCGYAISDGTVGRFGDRKGENIPDVTVRLRKRVKYLRLAAYALSLLCFIFAATPFIYAVGDAGMCADSGLSYIAAMFGAVSGLAAFGANTVDVRVVGWIYFSIVLVTALTAVCFITNSVKANRPLRPYGLVVATAILFGFSTVLISYTTDIVSALAAKGYSVGYLGVIGMTVSSVAALVAAITAWVFARAAYPRVNPKINKPRIAYYIMLGAACLVSVGTIAVPFSATNYARESDIRSGDAGIAILKMDEAYDKYYVGTTVFYLKELKEGASYTFSVDFDAEIAAEDLDGAVLLYSADSVKGKSSTSILSMRYILSNQSSGKGVARLNFENGYGKNLAIVVNAAAIWRTQVKFSYVLTETRSA